jgi:rhodanese-related sulfurtransferase/CBS domain-containing protein
MPEEADRQLVQRLIAERAQIVEILAKDEYEEWHLPGAINLPLRRLETDAQSQLDPARPVLVYCWDTAWDLSPRAAWRLESLGFAEVYDYVAGKQDWVAANLPFEGNAANRPLAGTVARDDVPICGLEERVGDVRARVQKAEWDACVVVNDERIVLGLLREAQLGSRDDAVVEDAMRPGPSTFRPFVSIEEMAAFMTEHELESSPVTTSEGRLVGLLRREDAVRAAHEQHSHHHEWFPAG